MCYFVALLTFFIRLFTPCKSLEEDIYCSSEHLQQALLVGNHVLRQVDMRKIENNVTKEQINRYKFDLGFYISLSEKWTDGIARHPIYIYSMVRDLYRLRKLEKNLPHTFKMTDLPTKEDLTGTVSALVRLQYTFNLKAADMAAGIIAGERSVSLSAEDCLVIGAQAHVESKFENAIEWLDQALSVNSPITETTKEKIYAIKCSCEFRMGLKNDALKSVDSWLNIDEGNALAKEMKANIQRMSNRKTHMPVSRDMQDYMNLCRGEMTKESNNETVLSNLYCRFYDNEKHPLLILQPARQEDVKDDPYIKVYRDVISEADMRTIKTLVKPKLKVSKVIKKNPGAEEVKMVTSDSRISKGHFMRETDPMYTKLIRQLKRRVQAITGLRSESYESLQVSNYGIGGYYHTHYDWTPNHANPLISDRIATFLFYLNEVEAGGATVFPRIGVRMAPGKGDAIFWYNLHRNGLGNEKTFHAGCPILLGTKWIANLWIGRHHQEFVRPCTLNEQD